MPLTPITRWLCVGLPAILLSGCVIPIPNVPERPPYRDTLDFLVVGQTTRQDIVARLGDPPIVRREGRFVAYGAARETAARFLGVGIVPTTFALEEGHFLFLEFDEHDVLRRDELAVTPLLGSAEPACDSLGYCVLWVDWETAGVFPLWMSSGDVRRGELAVLTASYADETRARLMHAPATGCAFYFYATDRKTTWRDDLLAKYPGTAYFNLDDGPRFTDRGQRVFAVWPVERGAHTIRATRSSGELIEAFPVTCTDGSVRAVHGEVLPTFAGRNPRVRFAEVSRQQAAAALDKRRLLLQ